MVDHPQTEAVHAWKGIRTGVQPWRVGARAGGRRAILCVIHVLDAEVKMEIELPGVLRVIASGLKETLQKVGQLLLTRK
ncbi:hypothetical protein [Variovorax guangxiensis]|uniref:hypothetical protein n=1 Tax=Variovorax guangxiensis TaxID=1775474 RepID=UPI002856F06F|nr:hypothetical protein [Variovorax guangxiensis]MDR6856196.1 hypothetical protein [Variovorax guangxiensis]